MFVIAQNGMGYDMAQLRSIGIRRTLSDDYVLETRMRCDGSRVCLGAFREKTDARRALHGIRRGEAKGESIVRVMKGADAYRYIG